MCGLHQPKGNGIKVGSSALLTITMCERVCVYAVVFWHPYTIKTNEAAKIRGAFYPVCLKKWMWLNKLE
jgi:hypothetical protein